MIEKSVLKNPSWDQLLRWQGGCPGASLSAGAPVLSHEVCEFLAKEAYRREVIVQRSVVLVRSIRELVEVLLVDRAEAEGGTARITSGASVLMSGGAEKSVEDILAEKLCWRGRIVSNDETPDIIGINQIGERLDEKRYVFLIHVARSFAGQIRDICSQTPDKIVGFCPLGEAQDLLHSAPSPRQMECRVLELVSQVLENESGSALESDF